MGGKNHCWSRGVVRTVGSLDLAEERRTARLLGHHTIQAKIGVEEQLSSETRPDLEAKWGKRTALLVSWRCANLGIAGLG